MAHIPHCDKITEHLTDIVTEQRQAGMIAPNRPSSFGSLTREEAGDGFYGERFAGDVDAAGIAQFFERGLEISEVAKHEAQVDVYGEAQLIRLGRGEEPG